jgi:hypothetical protein
MGILHADGPMPPTGMFLTITAPFLKAKPCKLRFKTSSGKLMALFARAQ